MKGLPTKWLQRLPRKESESSAFDKPAMSRREGRGRFTIVLITLHLVFAVALTASLHASKRTDLNGSWRFRIDRIEEGERQVWHKTSPPQTEVVRVPNTWNVGEFPAPS